MGVDTVDRYRVDYLFHPPFLHEELCHICTGRPAPKLATVDGICGHLGAWKSGSLFLLNLGGADINQHSIIEPLSELVFSGSRMANLEFEFFLS